MQPSTRIAVNTVAQYLRTIINVFLGLYSTRLILHALGNEDYGIYMLVAGIVGMLSFLTNAMSITTQRFLSFEQGAKNEERQSLIFANSLIMHVLLGVLVFIFLEIVGLFLFEGVLNIAHYRIAAAKQVYHISLAMVFVSILTSPFRACLVSHENLVFISIIDVVDGLWKVIIAIIVTNIHIDKLVLYAYLTLGIYIFAFVSMYIYTFLKYKECNIPKYEQFSKTVIKELASFAGWSLYSSACIVGRNQGIAIVLNRFFGTVINASYGVAVQVSGALNFIASSLLMAFNPPISKAAGQNNIDRMFKLSMTASKMSLILMCMFGIPLLCRLSDILKLWLGEEPENASLLCSVIMISAIIDQTTSGLISANRALGKLKLYSLTVDSIKLSVIPILALCLYFGVSIEYAIWSYAIAELLSAVTRLPILKRNANLNIGDWFKAIYIKTILPIVFLLIINYVLSFYPFNVVILVTESIVASTIYLIICYFVAFNKNERDRIDSLIGKLLKLRVK